MNICTNHMYTYVMFMMLGCLLIPASSSPLTIRETMVCISLAMFSHFFISFWTVFLTCKIVFASFKRSVLTYFSVWNFSI